MKSIFWYLQCTKDNGMLFNPSNKLVLGFYYGTDFAGSWGHENPQELICARIRTRFVANLTIVTYCGCQNVDKTVIYSISTKIEVALTA